MTLQHPTNRAHSRKVAAKAAYSKEARRKLIESRSKLDGVVTGVKQAITLGRLRASKQLDLALRAIEISFEAVETRLRDLQKSGEDDWEELRVQLESAWENLAHSIKNLVARFADESRQRRDRDD